MSQTSWELLHLAGMGVGALVGCLIGSLLALRWRRRPVALPHRTRVTRHVVGLLAYFLRDPTAFQWRWTCDSCDSHGYGSTWAAVFRGARCHAARRRTS